MTDNKLQEDIIEINSEKNSDYLDELWFNAKNGGESDTQLEWWWTKDNWKIAVKGWVDSLLSDTEKRVREEPVPIDDSMRYVKPTHLLERWKLLKDLPGIPKGTIFIEEQDPERCGYRYYPDLDTDINMQYNTDWFFRENPDWFDLLKGVPDGK